MSDKIQALNAFWNRFNLIAYDENTVKSDQQLPYITYNVTVGNFGEPVIMTASLWYRSRSWAAITQKADEIYRAIGIGGVTIPYDGGILWIKRGSPFYNRMPDEDDSIRRIVINIEAEYESAY